MENNNWEPRIGQTVVALQTIQNCAGVKLVKGEKYTVLSKYQCPACGKWHANIGLYCKYESWMGNECAFCDHATPIYDYILVYTNVLAPINPYSNSVSLELANEAIKERLEVDGPVKEIVNN
jgi:hypothetical protein